MAIRARVYLVRHGETDANRTKIIQGQLDFPLNQMGSDQAARLADVLRAIKFDVALSSDLSRCTETAAIILKEQPGLVLERQEGLRERFMGELQGQVYGTRLAGGVPSMEARAALARRALAWWRMNIAEYTASLVLREEPYNILAVSHGGFLGILMESLVEAGDAGPADGVALGWLPNASVSLIEWDGQKGTIVRYGDDGHLAPAGRLDHNVDVIPI